MRIIKLNILFLIVAVLFIILPPLQAQAKVCEIADMNMEITVPEDTVILTQDTSNMDGLWLEAGITDPKTEKSNMMKMGSRAILYDPNSGTKVNLLQKRSNQSSDIFNLSLLSDEEVDKFFQDILSIKDANTDVSVEKYTQKEVLFYRLAIDYKNNNVVMKEIVYGTIVNGDSISYHVYDEKGTKTMDESYIQKLVAGTHFTKILTLADYEKQRKSAMISIAWKAAVFLAVILLWIFIHKYRRKKQEQLRKRKLDLQEQFNKNQKLKEEQHIKDEILFINKTHYTENVIKDFCYYNAVFRRIKLWILVAVLGIVLFITYYESGRSIYNWLIAIVLIIAVVYIMGTQIEKRIKQTIKNYGSYLDKEAIATFYEDYFTVSGLQYKSDFPYVQITDIKEHKAFYYIYIGERTIYLKKEGFEQGAENFKSFIKKHIMKI